MTESLRRLRLRWGALAAGVVVLDQVTKWMVVKAIPLWGAVTVIPGFFDVSHVRNTGAAFGLFASFAAPWRTWLLNGVATLVFAAVLVYALRTPATEKRVQTGLALILGGAVGNLIDRVTQGFVTDFLHVYVGKHQWPDFNAADSAISIGVVLLAWDAFRSPEEAPERPESSAGPAASGAATTADAGRS